MKPVSKNWPQNVKSKLAERKVNKTNVSNKDSLPQSQKSKPKQQISTHRKRTTEPTPEIKQNIKQAVIEKKLRDQAEAEKLKELEEQIKLEEQVEEKIQNELYKQQQKLLEERSIEEIEKEELEKRVTTFINKIKESGLEKYEPPKEIVWPCILKINPSKKEQKWPTLHVEVVEGILKLNTPLIVCHTLNKVCVLYKNLLTILL